MARTAPRAPRHRGASADHGCWLPLAALLLASPVAAQSRTGRAALRGERHFAVVEGSVAGAHATLGSDRVFGAVLVTGGSRLLREQPGLVVDVEASWRFFCGAASSASGESRPCAVGNPTVYGLVGWSDGESAQARGGLGLAAPLSYLGSGRAASYLMYYGRAQWGFWDGWEGIDPRLGLVLRGDADFRADALIAGVDGAVGVSLMPFDGDPTYGREPIAHYQLGGYVGAQATEWLALGGRIQVAGWTDGGGDPARVEPPADAQVSVIPFVRLRWAPVFVELRGTINLDDPLGLGELPSLWAVQLGVGATWGAWSS